MDEQLIKRAKEIIENNLYITLASIGSDNLPWVTPLYAAYDADYSFYWSSDIHAKHSQNLRQNKTVTFVIFDSQAPWGKGEAVYIQANVTQLEDKEAILDAFTYRYGRIKKPFGNPQDFLGASPKRIYKAEMKKAWILTSVQKQGYFDDGRLEISLK